MKKNNLLLLGLGAAVVGYILYTRKSGSSSRTKFEEAAEKLTSGEESPESVQEEAAATGTKVQKAIQQGKQYLDQAEQSVQVAEGTVQTAVDTLKTFARTPEQKAAAMKRREARRKKMAEARAKRKTKKSSRKPRKKRKVSGFEDINVF